MVFSLSQPYLEIHSGILLDMFCAKAAFSKEFSKKYLNPSDESVSGVRGPGLSPESYSSFWSIQRQEYKHCRLFTVVR